MTLDLSVILIPAGALIWHHGFSVPSPDGWWGWKPFRMFTSHGVFSLAKSNSKCSAYLFSACFFFLLDYRRSLYETVQLPSQIDALQIQIPVLWLAFSLSLRYFLINRISYFNEMQLLVFPSYLALFLSWRILLSPKAVGDTLLFSSKSFLVLPFTLTFPILLGLIFMEGDSRGYDSFSPHCYAAGWALFMEEVIFFSTALHSHLCHQSSGNACVELFLDSYFVPLA